MATPIAVDSVPRLQSGRKTVAEDSRLSPLFTWRSLIVDSDLHPTTRHVALTLSMHMSERGGSCFPSIATLARETGLHGRTISDKLSELEARGFLARRVERKGEGRGTRIFYSATDPTTTRVQTAGGPDDHLLFDNTTTRVQTAGVEDVIESDRRSLAQTDDQPPSPSFEAFWAQYPRKAGKGQARRAWGKLGLCDRALALAAVPRFALVSRGVDAKFIKHPSTWLNGECWLDDGIAPEPELPDWIFEDGWLRDNSPVEPRPDQITPHDWSNDPR